MSKAVWITWENQVRNKSLSARLGVDLHVIVSQRRRIMRYLVCALRTLYLIWQQKPSVVFVQNPSVVLTCLTTLLKYPFRYQLVIDAHLAGITAPNGNRVFQKVLDFCNRLANLVIVTTDAHRKYVEAGGGQSFVCEDPLPDIARFAKTKKNESRDVFFICSFDIDEPYVDVFNAARILQPEGYVLSVSGNFRKVQIEPKDWPHIHFTGYVPEEEFYEKLARAQIVVDLTNQENCLVCGAYEAMALNKPLVTSNTLALRTYFTAGTLFVEHNPESIAEGIRTAFAEQIQLKSQIQNWTPEAATAIARKIEEMRQLLNLPEQVNRNNPS